MEDLRESIEAYGRDFTAEEIRNNLIQAQRKTWDFVEELSGLIVPGMKESEAIELCDDLYVRRGVEKKWHKNRIRFGINTLLAFKDLSNSDIRLQEDDIYFMDIGPVVSGFEGDCGKTFVVGQDPEKRACAQAARDLFDLTQEQWSHHRLSGQKLYEWATLQAQKMGWELNLNLAGHRVSEFPHALHYKGNMKDLGFDPSSGLWILEIQIRHPRKPYGAFFEDLLISA